MLCGIVEPAEEVAVPAVFVSLKELFTGQISEGILCIIFKADLLNDVLHGAVFIFAVHGSQHCRIQVHLTADHVEEDQLCHLRSGISAHLAVGKIHQFFPHGSFLVNTLYLFVACLLLPIFIL